MSKFLNVWMGFCLGFMYASFKLSPTFVCLQMAIILGVGAILRPILARNHEGSVFEKVMDGVFAQFPLAAIAWFSYAISMLVLPHLHR